MMKTLLAHTVIVLLLFQGAAIASGFRFSPRPNKAHEIRWRPWGPEAFAEAKAADKLVLLSLSAVWCHWCHVMDETTYSDAEVIALINERFIPVRVDSDMRPDVDSMYNQGGWPSTAILTPEGEVLDGGNYIPPRDLLARLSQAAEVFATERGRIEKMLARLAQQRRVAPGGISGPPDRSMVDGIVGLLGGVFDEQYGGFGTGQKFPNTAALDFLLAAYHDGRDRAVRRMVMRTLDGMAKGAIHDRAGGGFFRYATKQDWSEPHYEKMLDVNAGLLENYSRAYQVLRIAGYRRTLDSTARYVLANLYDRKSGALFGSQDADEEYYRPGSRRKRKAPAVDRTSYTDSSSLMISALVAAWEATGNRKLLNAAEKAAERAIKELYRPGAGVFHAVRDGVPSLTGQLMDNVLFGTALLDLYNATGTRHYLDRAGRIGQLVASRFYDAGRTRFRLSLASPGPAQVTTGALAEQNGNRANYSACRFLARLAAYTGDREARELAERVLGGLSGRYQEFLPHAPAYGLALRWVLNDPVEIHVLADGKRVREYLSAAAKVYAPEKLVKVLSLVDDREEIASYGYKARESAYICAGKRCSKPVRTPEKLAKALKEFLAEGGTGGR